jgi:hypothetical protein
MFSRTRAARPARRLAGAALLMIALAAPVASASITTVTTPNPGTTNLIGGLTAFPTNDVWAVGSASSSSYTGCHGRTLTARWDGRMFAEVFETPTATPICAAINGVSGAATDDIWAVGSTNSGRDPHVRHWNGKTWTASGGATIPFPPAGGRRLRTTGLNGVAALSGRDVWAVGRAMFADSSRHALIEHFTADGWSLASGPTSTGSVLNGISARTDSDIWAVGSTGGATGMITLATHYNGSGWQTATTPNNNANNELRGVAAVPGSGAVWAVGDSFKSQTAGISVSRTLIERYSGSAWTIVPSPNVGAGNNVLTGVAAHSPSDVWAVGYDDDITGQIPVRKTLWLHFNGLGWSVAPSPSVGSGDNTLLGVIAPAGTSDVWAWGGSADGTLVQRFTN